MVPTREVLSFVRKLEKMMNQFEGKDREVFRDIIIRIRRKLISVTEKMGCICCRKKSKITALLESKCHSFN